MNNIEKVVSILKKNTEGLTVVDISRLVGISRNTVAVVLSGLIGAEKIRVRPVGVAKLHYWINSGGKK